MQAAPRPDVRRRRRQCGRDRVDVDVNVGCLDLVLAGTVRALVPVLVPGISGPDIPDPGVFCRDTRDAGLRFVPIDYAGVLG